MSEEKKASENVVLREHGHFSVIYNQTFDERVTQFLKLSPDMRIKYFTLLAETVDKLQKTNDPVNMLISDLIILGSEAVLVTTEQLELCKPKASYSAVTESSNSEADEKSKMNYNLSRPDHFENN